MFRCLISFNILPCVLLPVISPAVRAQGREKPRAWIVESYARQLTARQRSLHKEDNSFTDTFMTQEESIGATPDIAVIGYAARVPGAENAAQLWENLCRGVESIRTFSVKNWSPSA